MFSHCSELLTNWGQGKMRVQKREGMKEGGQKNDITMVERPTKKKKQQSSVSPGAQKERMGRQMPSTSQNASTSFLVLAQLLGSQRGLEASSSPSGSRCYFAVLDMAACRASEDETNLFPPPSPRFLIAQEDCREFT